MKNKKVADAAVPADYSAGVALSVSHGFPVLDAFNPVVFLDIVCNSNRGNAQRQHRFFVELLANVNPLLARNFYNFCTGDFSRVKGGREQPCGYQGTVFFDAVPGKSLSGGDVVTNTGSANISSLQQPSSAKLSAAPAVPKLPASSSSNCCGYVFCIATATGTAGSQFRMSFGGEELPVDLAGLLGRLIVRTSTDIPAVLEALQEMTKQVWSAQRAAAHSSFPIVEQCGEM